MVFPWIFPLPDGFSYGFFHIFRSAQTSPSPEGLLLNPLDGIGTFFRVAALPFPALLPWLAMGGDPGPGQRGIRNWKITTLMEKQRQPLFRLGHFQSPMRNYHRVSLMCPSISSSKSSKINRSNLEKSQRKPRSQGYQGCHLSAVAQALSMTQNKG